jgi:hypothetical protein
MNILALALVKVMVWRMEMEVVVSIKWNVDIFQEDLEKNQVPQWTQSAFLDFNRQEFHII